MNTIDQIADDRDKLRVKLMQAKAKLKQAKLREDANALARDRVLQTLERVNTAKIRARAMICDAAGIPHDADILEWISGARERIQTLQADVHKTNDIALDLMRERDEALERIARLEEAGDECARYSTTQASDDWHAAKEAKP